LQCKNWVTLKNRNQPEYQIIIPLITATEIFFLNEQGERRNNQDCIHPPIGHATTRDKLFIVCDGVGGENKGEVASQIVCQSISQYLIDNNQSCVSDQAMSENICRVYIEKAISYANGQLAEYAHRDRSATRMSTTLSLIFLGERSIIAAWCGDTRIHHIRDGNIIWKSDDHSLVHELVKTGEISEEDARSHPRRNLITRSLNALNTNNTVDFYEIIDSRDGDFILLCTDGFLEQVDNDVIHTVLSEEEDTSKSDLFLSFCVGKTKDNFSMYLVRVSNSESNHDKV
jgi:serine/threonine protein phosphatase PrpC